MDKQQVPPSYGLFLLGKKQKKQVQDSTSELSQSNAFSRDYEPSEGNYRNSTLANAGNIKSQGYHEANHNNLLNEVRSQLSDLRDLLSSSKGSEIHEASVESSDLRITDEQLAQMAPKERALFLQRIPELQNELFSEGISSSISVGETADSTFPSRRFQPPAPAARQAVHTPTSVNAGKTAQPDTLLLQSSKSGPPRMARVHTGTPNQNQTGKGYVSMAKTLAGSSFTTGDDSRRSASDQPRVVSIQRANLEVGNISTVPHDVETSVESDFSASDITDVIEANVVLPPRLPQPPPAMNQRSTSSKRAKTPSEPRTVIQRVKPEIDDAALPLPDPSTPCDSEVDLNEYDAKLTVRRRPQSAGDGMSGSNKNSSYDSKYARSSLQAQKPNASLGTQNGLDDSDHSDLHIPSSNAAVVYTKQSRPSARDTSAINYNRNVVGPYGYGSNVNEPYDGGVGSASRSNPNKGTLKSPGNGRQTARLQDSDSFDDDVINNVHAAAGNFVKLPKQTKQAPLKPEDSEPTLADVMTIPESTVLYNPRQHRSTSGRYTGAVGDTRDQSFSGRKPRHSAPGAIDDDNDAFHGQQDNTYEHTNVLSIQREPLLRSKLQKEAGADINNASRYANTSIPRTSGYYGEDVSIEDDVQETKLFISAADAGRSRLISDKSIGEKKHKRQHQGPNHTIITQLAQYETKPRDQTTQNESDEEYSSSDPEVTISKLVYPKLTPAEQEKLRRLAEVRSKQPKAPIPDVHLYGRPKTDELEPEGTNPLKQKDSIPPAISAGNADSSHLYSNVTPYYQYKRQLAKNTPQGFMKAKSMKDSVSDDMPAQEVTQFVNSKYVEMARAVGMTDPSILHNDVAKNHAKGTPLGSALHIRSDMTLGDIARSGRKFVMARKEESAPADGSRVIAAGRDGYTQRDDSSDSEPQYEDMTILPAAEPYYGLPQPDFESFNHSIQSMRQSLLMRSSNTQSASLTENQFDDRLARTKEAIKTAERQNGLSPSVLTTGSLSTNWMQATSPTTYMPQLISPAAHPRIRPTSRSHPPAPEPPLPDPHPEGGQIPQATIQRMNSMSDMVMPDRTASASSTSSGASGTLMQQLQKYGTIDPKIGLQSAAGIPRSSRTQATPRTSGPASQNSRGSRPGQSQSSGRPGSMSGPRPSKRMYLQATTQDPDNMVEAVALAEYIVAQNQMRSFDSDCSTNLLAVLSDLQFPANRGLEDLKGIPNIIVKSNIPHNYTPNLILYAPHCQSVGDSIISTNQHENQSPQPLQLCCTPDYHLSTMAYNPDTIENLNETIDMIALDAPSIHNAKCDIVLGCQSPLDKQIPNRNPSTIKLDLTLPSINIQLQPSVSENDELSFTSSNDTDVEFAAPEYMLKPQRLIKAPPHTLVPDVLNWRLDTLSYALKECQPRSRPLLLETPLKAIWNFSEDTFSATSIDDSDSIIESRPAPNFFFPNGRLENLQTMFATFQPKQNDFINLGQNRRSSLQYYKNAQLLLHGFVPDGSTGSSILQSHRHKIDSTHYATPLLTQYSLNENTIDSYDNERSAAENGINQEMRQSSLHKDLSLGNDYYQIGDQINKQVASLSQQDSDTSPRVHLGLSASNSESSYIDTLTANPIAYNLIKSNPCPVTVDSEEIDISLVETLRPPVDIEAPAVLSPKLSKELTLQQSILKYTDTNLPQRDTCTATAEIKMPHTSNGPHTEVSVKEPVIKQPLSASAIPLYTMDPTKSEATQHLYAHSQWYFPENSIIFEAPGQSANSKFILQNNYDKFDCIVEAEVETELTLKEVRQNLDSICLNTIPTVADPYFLFQRSISTYTVEKEYITTQIHKTRVDETITAVPVYSINKTREHNIRITSGQRELRKAGDENITHLTRALNAVPVNRDHDQQCFEIELPFIKRTTSTSAHAALDNIYSDVIAMHDVIVKTQSSKVKFFESNSDDHTIIRSQPDVEFLHKDFHVHDLTRSISAYVGLSRYDCGEKVAKFSIDCSKKMGGMNLRSSSVTRSYTRSTDYPNIQMTRLGNMDILKLSDSATPVSTLRTQKSYTLKVEKDLDEVPLEITVPKRAHNKSYIPAVEEHALNKYNKSVDKAIRGSPHELSSKDGYARPVYTLGPSNILVEEKAAHVYSVNGQRDRPECIMQIHEEHVKDCDIEEETVPRLETHWELALENQQQSNTPYFDSLDRGQKALHTTRPIDTIPTSSTKPHIKRPQEELSDSSSDAPVVKSHARVVSAFKQPVNIQKSIISLTDASANNSYTSLLSIEGPSLPLRFDFSKPDYTVSIATFDDTLESTRSMKANMLPKYTNFDTPSVIPSTLLTNEMTFQTPETMAEGISTNMLLYPQQTLQLREPMVESESEHAEPSAKNNFIFNPIESEVPQLYTKSNFYIKLNEEALNESIIAQECKKTDFVRTCIKVKHALSDSTETEDPIPLSIATRHSKRYTKKVPADNGANCKSVPSQPHGKVVTGTAPLSGSVSSSVSELLSHINAAIAFSKDTMARDHPSQNKLLDSTTTSEAAIDFPAILEYGTERPLRQKRPLKQLSCTSNYNDITNSLIDAERKPSAQEPLNVKHAVSMIKLETSTDTKVTKDISIEPISTANLDVALPPPFPPSYKAAAIDRAVETRGPYLIKKATSEKNTLAAETMYSMRRPPVNYSDESSSSSTNIVQEESVIGPAVSGGSSNLQNEPEYTKVMLCSADRSYKHQSPNAIQTDSHGNSGNYPNSVLETSSHIPPHTHVISSQKVSETYKEGLSAILQALQSLVDISRNNMLYAKAYTDYQKNAVDPLLWEEYVKKLEFLANSVKLSSDTILDLKIAFQTLNDKLIDKIASDIKDSILTGDQSASTTTFSEKENVELLPSTTPISIDHVSSLTVGAQAGLNTKPVSSVAISRLEELQRLYRELSASKDVIDKYANIIDSPAHLVNPTSTSNNIRDEPLHPIKTNLDTGINNFSSHAPGPTGKLGDVASSPAWNKYIHSMNPIENDPPQSHNRISRSPVTPVFNRPPMKPKKEISLPVMSTSLVAKVKKEAKRRREISEDALVHSRTLGPYLRQIAYTEDSIAKHVTFEIFNDIIDSITIECVESTKRLMGL